MTRQDKAPKGRDVAAAIACLTLMAACGGGRGRERAYVPSPPPAVVTEEAPPSAPDDVGVVVRVRDADRLAGELAALAPAYSAPLRDAPLAANAAVTSLVGSQLSSVIGAHGEVDLVFFRGRETPVASFAVRRDLGARPSGFVVREDAGLHTITPEGPPEGSRLTACALVDALIDAPRRLVCAEDRELLQRSAKYVARTLPAQGLDVDARVTFSRTWLRAYAAGMTEKSASMPPSGARLGPVLLSRLIDDLGEARVDVMFGETDVVIAAVLDFTRRESELTRVLTPKTTPAPPPPAFYALPADSRLALYSRGATAEDLAPLRAAFGGELQTAMVGQGYTVEQATAMREKVEAVLLRGGPFVLAAGVSSALPALGAGPAHGAAPKRAPDAARAALAPWVIVQSEESPEKLIPAVRALVEGAQAAAAARPEAQRSTTPVRPEHVELRIVPLPPALSLPPGALRLEVLSTAQPKGAPRPSIFVVPHKDTTWLGYGEDAGAVADRLRTAFGERKDAPTLASTKEASSLHNEFAFTALTTTLSGVALLTGGRSSPAEMAALTGTLAAIAQGPDHGTQPIIVTSTTAAGAAQATRLSVRARASRETFASIAALIAR